MIFLEIVLLLLTILFFLFIAFIKDIKLFCFAANRANYNKAEILQPNFFFPFFRKRFKDIQDFFCKEISLKTQEEFLDDPQIVNIVDADYQTLLSEVEKKISSSLGNTCYFLYGENLYKDKVVYTSNLTSKNAITILEKRLNIFFDQADSTESFEMFRVINEAEIKNDTSLFFQRGIVLSYAVPIHYAVQGALIKLILWVGYSDQRLLTKATISRIKAAAEYIGKSFQKYYAEQSLNLLISQTEERGKKNVEIISSLSHDIRTPLSIVRNVLFYLSQDNDVKKNKDAKGMLKIAEYNCERLHDLVSDLLDFTIYKEGKLQYKAQRVNIIEEVKLIFKNFKLLSTKENITLKFNVNGIDNHEGYFNASVYEIIQDPRHLRRIITNILSNAYKYTNEGEIVLSIEREINCIVLVIKDTGIGISKENLNKLFTPFHRFSDINVEGIGIGLSICKILCDVCGIGICVESELSKGTVFKLRFCNNSLSC
jgi:signal transduction histidine kinase